MADLLPAASPPPNPLMPKFGGAFARVGQFAREPLAAKALPWFVGIGGAGLAALAWAALSPAPQRVLYGTLDDGERAEIVAALDSGGIEYTIDSATGALSVPEDDIYRARMIVAQTGAIAAPEDGTTLLSNLPMGASRTLEGDRLRAARERDLELSIAQIDTVEAVRVHLAQPERSVFVREEAAPSASVMVTLRGGRSLTARQVQAIAGLVASSVPGLSQDAVSIVDQHGKLLTQPEDAGADLLAQQSRVENQLQSRLAALLTPLFGEGGFSTEISAELDREEVTSARESYEKDGALRREETSRSTGPAERRAGGIPGATTNLPPADAVAEERAPQGGELAADAGQNAQSQTSRQWDVGREVAVSSRQPGMVRRLSVAVAIDQAALRGTKTPDLNKIEQLVASAVGADTQRGDQVTVIARAFAPVTVEDPGFWEQPWFAALTRNLVALLAVLLVALFAVRPLVKAARARIEALAGPARDEEETAALPSPADETLRLAEQVELVRRIAREQPGDARNALRALLSPPPPPTTETLAGEPA